MKISACWIVKNEEASLARSIESVKDVVDELIVVDTGSTDNTVEIAQSYGARVEYFEWIDDFAAARNYALSFSIGDVFIFLDADEWFVPNLSNGDRLMLERVFADRRIDAMKLQLSNLDMQTDKTISVITVDRIFRNKPSMRYSGRIHEFIHTPDRGLTLEFTRGMHISHSGYSTDVFGDKVKRNISLLEDELAAIEPGSDERARFLTYLVREYYSQRDPSSSAKCLVELLTLPDGFRETCSIHGAEMLSAWLAIFGVAVHARSRMSRKDLKGKLFQLFTEVYPNYPCTPEMDVLYQALFDIKEDRFLREVGPAREAADRLPHGSIDAYRAIEGMIDARAAVAAHRRGDYLAAMEYAVKAFRSGNHKMRDLFAVLTDSLRGQPPEEVVQFLSGVLDVDNPEDLNYLIRGTFLTDFLMVHAYFLKKRIDKGQGIPSDRMYYPLVRGDYDEAAQAAVREYKMGSRDDGRRQLLVAALCGASQEIVQKHAAILGDYVEIVNAFYSGTAFSTITQTRMAAFQTTFFAVAVVGGLECAQRYLHVFSALPSACYQAMGFFSRMNGRPDLLLQMDMTGIEPLNWACREYTMEAMVQTRRYEEALAEIERFLRAEMVVAELLHWLLVVAEQAEGDTQVRARRLYDQYIEVFDATVDLRDVVNTGIVVAEGNQKQKLRGVKNLAKEQLDRAIADAHDRPATAELLNVSRKAAEIFLQGGYLSEAMRCLVRVVAHEATAAEDYETLAKVFDQAQNAGLAACCREKAAHV